MAVDHTLLRVVLLGPNHPFHRESVGSTGPVALQTHAHRFFLRQSAPAVVVGHRP